MGRRDEGMVSKCMSETDEKNLNKAWGSAAPSAGLSDGKQIGYQTQSWAPASYALPAVSVQDKRAEDPPGSKSAGRRSSFQVEGRVWWLAARSRRPAVVSFRWSHLVPPWFLTVNPEHSKL